MVIYVDDYGKMLAELKQVHTIKEMAELLGCSQRTVARRLNEYGLSSFRGRLDINDGDVLKLWNDGFTIVEIASKFDCSHDTITKRLAKMGVSCDRVTGIKKHFARTHAEMWPDIKKDLDAGMSSYAVSRKYRMRYQNVERLMQLNKYGE